MKYFIYIIQNKVNNKLYVGVTKNIQQRWYTHLSNARYPGSAKHQYIHSAINKYGSDNFTILEIDSFENQNDALQAEQFWIQFFRSWDKNYGYNLTLGGEGSWGRKLSKEHKEKISISLLGNKRSTGVKHTLETKQKMSTSHTGTKNHKAKLTEQDVCDIRLYHLNNIESNIDVFNYLSIQYNLSISGLEKIIYRKTWKHVI
jgi:group I intron endonuclease